MERTDRTDQTDRADRSDRTDRLIISAYLLASLMQTTILSLGALVGYGWSWLALLAWLRLGEAGRLTTSRTALLVALGLHATALAPAFTVGGVPGFWQLISATLWIAGALLIGLRQAQANGILLLPLVCLGLGLGTWWPAPPAWAGLSVSVYWHVLLALPVGALLLLNVAQAALILRRDAELRRPHLFDKWAGLPPLQTIETGLKRSMQWGFGLLTANLFFGIYSNYQQSGRALEFNHHILLVVMTWVCYAALLVIQRRAGSRGRPVAMAAIGCFALLLLAYYGSRFVSRVLLG